MTKKQFSLSQKDKRLLAVLEKDGRASFSTIARAIGVSKEVANYRFKRLENAGFLVGIAPVVDYFAAGYDCYRLLLNLTNLQPTTRQEIVAALRKMPNTSVMLLLQSSWDILLETWSKNSVSFGSMLDEHLSPFSQFIAEKQIFVVTKLHYYRHAFLHGNHDKISLGQLPTAQQQTLIEENSALLSLLQKESRGELIDIGKALHLSPLTFKARIKKLMGAHVLKGFRPLLSFGLLKSDRHLIHIVLTIPSVRKSLLQYLGAMENVVVVAEYTGQVDIGCEVITQTSEELDRFLRELRIHVQGIKDFEVIPMLS